MRKFLLLAFAILLFPISALADDSLSISGYYKSFFVVFDPPEFRNPSALPLPDQSVAGSVNNRLRLSCFYKPNNRFSFNVAYDISPRVQDSSLFGSSLTFAEIDPFGYRFSDLNTRLYPSQDEEVDSFAIFQNLDRAFATITTQRADIFIGRQAIAWGSARVINPTDIIAPFSYEELDVEDRIGVDAVRVRVPMGFMGEFDLGYIFGKDFKVEKSAFYVRNKFYALETDVSLLLLGFRENLLAGIDVARSIGGAGFWFESAYVFVDALDGYEAGKEHNYFRASIGLDYSFTEKTYGFIEYHFSEAGSREPENYLKNLSSPAFTEGAVYLMGEHYLAPGMTYQITPLITFTGQMLINVTDPSAFLAPQVEYNIAKNIYLSAGAFIGLGENPEFVITNGPSPVFRSEFGGYPNIYYTSFRIYF
jgi:hypothetical protein